MKILFLDIDGVMNSLASAHELGTLHKFAKKSVDALNEVLAKTGAKVVISSSWRISHSTEEMQEILNEQGVNCEVIDETPIGEIRLDTSGIYASRMRGDEIAMWLYQHEGEEVDGIAIVDDNSDMTTLTDKLVLTTWDTGLGPEHVDALVSKLEEPFKFDPSQHNVKPI